MILINGLLLFILITIMLIIKTNGDKEKEETIKQDIHEDKGQTDMPTSSKLVYNTNDAVKLFGEGLRTAGNRLGLITNHGLPNMLLSSITKSISNNMPFNNIDINLLKGNIFNGFFRLLGFDTEKLQAIALNAIVFIAQMIGSNLTKKQLKKDTINEQHKKNIDNDEESNEETDIKTGSPIEWVFKNAPVNIKRTMIEAQEINFSDELIQETSRGFQENGYCLQHIICRLAPVIKGMQESSKQLYVRKEDKPLSSTRNGIKLDIFENWSGMTPSERMYAFMPNNNEFMRQKNYCNEKLPPCKI